MNLRAATDVPGGFWFYLGIVVGMLLAATTLAAVMTWGADSDLKTWADFLYKWQTLITGILAIAGAAMTVAVVHHQIEASERLENDRRYRQHFAARAAMPSALSELRGYADQYLKVLKAVRAAQGGAIGQIASTLPVPPAGALRTLQTCIETAEVAEMHEIVKIFEELQVMDARLRGLFRERNGPIVEDPFMQELLIDGLEFQLRCNEMFDYARRKANTLTVLITADDMRTRAFFEGLDEGTYPGIREIIRSRYPPAQA